LAVRAGDSNTSEVIFQSISYNALHAYLSNIIEGKAVCRNGPTPLKVFVISGVTPCGRKRIADPVGESVVREANGADSCRSVVGQTPDRIILALIVDIMLLGPANDRSDIAYSVSQFVSLGVVASEALSCVKVEVST
jgi:hypothetical protein